MRKWLKRLFYIICFFVMGMVIYHLALITPPQPTGEKQSGMEENRKRHLTDRRF